jgi:hypothetical protein
LVKERIHHLACASNEVGFRGNFATVATQPPTDNECLRLSLTSRHRQGDLAPLVKAVRASYLNEIVEGEQHQRKELLAEMEKVY